MILDENKINAYLIFIFMQIPSDFSPKLFKPK